MTPEEFWNENADGYNQWSELDAGEKRMWEHACKVFKDLTLDVMNLGMTHRQHQLSGEESRSGNEVLKEFLDTRLYEQKES